MYVYFYGLETHVYNRTSVYDALRDLFQIREGKRDWSETRMLRLSSKKNPDDLMLHASGSNKHRALVEDDDDETENDVNGSVAMLTSQDYVLVNIFTSV